MTIKEIMIGDIVTGIYKTGKYIGEVTGISPNHYLLKVKAVLKHPMQGDLHNPKQVNVGFFHERKALAKNEQTNVPKAMVHHYTDEIPSYQDSLKTALERLKAELAADNSEWAIRCLDNLSSIEKDYFK